MTSASSTRDVLCLAQHVPQRRRDLAGREDAGGHLVQQRLEEVVVPAVEQRHVDTVDVSEEAAGGQPAEAAADARRPDGSDSLTVAVPRR